jgi:hypothetical protein
MVGKTSMREFPPSLEREKDMLTWADQKELRITDMAQKETAALPLIFNRVRD